MSSTLFSFQNLVPSTIFLLCDSSLSSSLRFFFLSSSKSRSSASSPLSSFFVSGLIPPFSLRSEASQSFSSSHRRLLSPQYLLQQSSASHLLQSLLSATVVPLTSAKLRLLSFCPNSRSQVLLSAHNHRSLSLSAPGSTVELFSSVCNNPAKLHLRSPLLQSPPSSSCRRICSSATISAQFHREAPDLLSLRPHHLQSPLLPFEMSSSRQAQDKGKT